jgi:hypothetical protein
MQMPTIMVCSVCHLLQILTQQGLDADRWTPHVLDRYSPAAGSASDYLVADTERHRK